MKVSSFRRKVLQSFDQLSDEGKRQAAEVMHHLASTLRPSRFTSRSVELAEWEEVVEQFGRLPKPRIERDDEAGTDHEEEWIYRGQNGVFSLAPSIERQFWNWAEMEYRILREFKSKAPLHFETFQLPVPDASLEWCALMQHHGVPTRLLDFTYSPYVALYFAIRNRCPWQIAVEVWAIDATALRDQCVAVIMKARRKAGEAPQIAPLPKTYVQSSSEGIRDEEDFWKECIGAVLKPPTGWRNFLTSDGLVLVGLPEVQSPRLLRQQGVFLLNGSENLSFEESLEKMMSPVKQPWLKIFRIRRESLERIERELFQMNLHDLSLFPDAEGLAGVVRQKARLHW